MKLKLVEELLFRESAHGVHFEIEHYTNGKNHLEIGLSAPRITKKGQVDDLIHYLQKAKKYLE